jgi:hypothetical protein
MTAYLILFSVPAWFALTRVNQLGSSRNPTIFQWKLQSLFLVLIIGLRHETGGDWFLYEAEVTNFTTLPFYSVITENQSDPAFRLLAWISPSFGGLHFVNTTCGAIFALGLIAFCREQPEPWLALTVSVPYLIIVVAMGYTRQGVAIGLAMLGLVSLSRHRLLKSLFWLSIASTFHKSAVILIPLAVFASARGKWISALGTAVVVTLAFVLFLQESVDRLYAGYVSDAMESSGALVRIIMNALPAVLFLLFRRKFSITESNKDFWIWMSFGAILFIPILAISPSSTAVDRVALYWIPIQIFVLSHLPTALRFGPRSESMIRITIVTYSFTILLVWLLASVHAYNWLPYRFYPFELIHNSLFW